MSTSELAIPLQYTFVSLYTGIIIMSIIYGAVTVQGYRYYRAFPNDRVPIKVLVGFLWILDTGHTVTTSYGIYACFNMVMIGSVDDLLRNRLPLGFALLFAFTVINGACVRAFYIFRIWKLSDHHHFLAGVLFVLLLYTAAVSFALSVKGFMLSYFYQISQMKTLIYLALGSVTFMDWTLCLVLSGLLLRQKAYFKRTKSLLHSLILYSVTSGLLTSVLSLGVLFSFIFGSGLIWVGPWILFDKSYLLACYTTLSNRQSFRSSDGMIEVILSGVGDHESHSDVHHDIQFAEQVQETKITVTETPRSTLHPSRPRPNPDVELGTAAL